MNFPTTRCDLLRYALNGLCWKCAAQEMRRPNVLFLVVDALRPERCHGFLVSAGMIRGLGHPKSERVPVADRAMQILLELCGEPFFRAVYDHRTDPKTWSGLVGGQRHTAVKGGTARWLPEKDQREVPSKRAYRFDSANFMWSKRQ